MPVTLFLSDDQRLVFEEAVKNKNIEYKSIGRGTVQLTAENWQEIRTSINDLYEKKFAVRTKTSDHLRICHGAQEILAKFQTLEPDLKQLVPVNDNKTVVAVEEEVKPELDDEWFKKAEVRNPPKKDGKNVSRNK